MLKTIKKAVKKWMNRKEIKALKDEQRGLELRLSSMEHKLFQSRSTAEFWEEQSKSALGTESEKRASVAYYWDDVKKDEAEIRQLKDEIGEITERLVELCE